MDEIIERIKKKLIYRAKCISMYNSKTTKVFHFEDGDFVYIVCNVMLTDYDNDMNPFQRYNLCSWYKEPTIKGEWTDGGRYIWESSQTIGYEVGLYPILLPQLIARLDKRDNTIVYGRCE